MKNIYESRFYSILSRVSDLVAANLLFLLGSLPIITIGVSMRALYRTVAGIDAGGYSVTRVFWSTYRESFRQVLACSAACTAAVAFLIFDLYIVTNYWDAAFAEISTGLLIAAGTVVLSAVGYLFPILSLQNISIRDAVAGSFVLSMRYLPNSLLICALNILPAAFAFFWTGILHVILPFWIFIGFSLAAKLVLRLLRPALNDIACENNGEYETDI